MNNYWLVLNGNTVVNIVVWDGVSEWGPGDGLVVEQHQDGVNIGATKNEDGTFTNVVPEVAE